MRANLVTVGRLDDYVEYIGCVAFWPSVVDHVTLHDFDWSIIFYFGIYK